MFIKASFKSTRTSTMITKFLVLFVLLTAVNAGFLVRSKRQLEGGASEISKDDSKIVQLTSTGLTHYNSQTTKTNKYKPVEVVSATEQVVAGSAYKIVVKIVESECTKNDNKELSACAVRAGSNPVKCVFDVWEKTWENFRQFTIKCDGDEKEYVTETRLERRKRELVENVNDKDLEEYRFKRQLFGGASEISKDNPKITELTSKGLTHYNSQTTKTYKYKPVEVVSATAQVVAGSAYKIVVKIVESECTKNDNKELNACAVRAGSQPVKCVIDVWEKTWQDFRQFTIKCDGDEKEYVTETKLE